MELDMILEWTRVREKDNQLSDKPMTYKKTWSRPPVGWIKQLAIQRVIMWREMRGAG